MLHVIDHEPHGWFLLGDGARLYLDIACEDSFVGYSVLIELDRAERRAWHEQGRSYLHRLAADVNDGAPIRRESTSPYKARDVSAQLGQAVLDAVLEWRSHGGDAAP